MEKICSKCGELKSKEDFYSSFNKCKTCVCKERKEYRLLNLEKLQDSDRNRRRKVNMSVNQWDSRKEYCKKYAKENPEIVKTTKLKYIEKNPVKRAAHVLVGNSIRSGKLIKQPCEVCNSEEVHAHHCDYSKPLDVMWLCPEHHAEWHRLHGEGLNSQ